MSLNYEKRLSQMQAQLDATAARYERKKQKAYKDACFTLGELLVDGIFHGEPDGINWKNVAMSVNDKRLKEFYGKKIFWNEKQVEAAKGEPGKFLKKYRDELLNSGKNH